MESLPPLSSAVRHGGNGYRGPGAWKRTRKKYFAFSEGPLDLGRILGNLDKQRNYLHQQQHGTKNRPKQGKAAALQARLESLSLALAPSHGVAESVLPAATTSLGLRREVDPSRPLHDPPEAQQQHHQQQHQSACSVEKALEGGLLNQHRSGANYGQQTPSAIEHHRHTTREDERNSNDSAQAASPVPSSANHQNAAASQRSHAHVVNALRVPNATTKMLVDDRCTSEILGARATLRALLNKQKRLGDDMRRRRLEVCLIDGSNTSENDIKVRPGKLTRRVTRKRSRQKDRLHTLKAGGGARGQGENRQRQSREGGRGAVKRGPHAHPLLFMAEVDVQKAELDQMRLEDTEATHLLKLEEARRRKQDYGTYYRLALRYGPLPEDQFDVVTYPGSHYHGKVLDATRVIQTWWWGVWPRLLRYRKAAALSIQSVFRGFLQRKKWHAIIRLRTLWGNTRIVTHSFLVWRGTAATARRVKAFARRFRNRATANCFKVLLCNAAERRAAREKLLRERLRRVSEGVRLRVFEGWARYTETSLAVERLRYRSVARRPFRGWRDISAEDRMRSRVRWACTALLSRLLRWKQRSRYTRLRESCVRIQVVARLYIASARIRKKIRDSRVRRAEEAIQALEDVRVRRLLNVEQERLDRLRAALDRDTPSTQKNVLALLGTAAGKATVASRLAMAPPFSESDADAKRETVRLFVRREQALIRHDFNAVSPPPSLGCPRSASCDATFVDRGHALRHAADVHPTDAPGIAELFATIRDPVGLAVFEEFIRAAAVAVEPGEKESTMLRARSDGPSPKKNDQAPASTAAAAAAAQSTLDLWKAIQEWRQVPSSSSNEGRYQQLGESVVNRGKHPHLPDDVRVALGGEQLRRVFGKFGAARSKTMTHLQRRDQHSSALELPSSRRDDDRVHVDVDPYALEEASFRAVVFLSESHIGLTFLGSAPYRTYLDGVHKPMRDAVRAAAAEIAAVETAEWAADARSFRKAALDREQEVLINSLADQASNLVLQAHLLEGLVDDQASLLAVIIIAERTTFAKVISAVWHETVDQAAHLAALELREIDPGVADALSEAACCVARSNIMDELIDQCAVDLTGPEGELWPDARGMVAVAHGVGYQVRSKVMSELIDAAVMDLSVSGEAEKLMSEATLARRRGQGGAGRGGPAVAEPETDDVAGYGNLVISGGDGVLADTTRAILPDNETQQRTATAAAAAASSSAVGAVRVGEAQQLDSSAQSDSYGNMSEEIPEANGSEVRREKTGRTTQGSKGSSIGTLTEIEAAVLVQSVLRRRAVYRKMKTVVARNFIRMYDPGEGAFYWYNQATMESSWDKPAIIDLYFKKPAVSKSILYLGETSSGGTRNSIVNGFESSAL